MASEASIARNVGGSLPRVAAAMASAVIELPTGPTDMMTSALLSLIADETLFGSNWITLILPGSLGFLRSSVESMTSWSGLMLILPQDHLEELDVAWRPPDHAEPLADHLLDFCDLRGIIGFFGSSRGRCLAFRGLALRSGLALCSGFAFAAGLAFAAVLGFAAAVPRPWQARRTRHDEHDDVLAQDGEGLAVLGHAGIAADHGEIGLTVFQGRRGGRRAAVDDLGLQPDIDLLARELRGDRLHHAGVLAVGRAHGDGELGRLRREVVGDRGETAAQHRRGDDDQPRCAAS